MSHEFSKDEPVIVNPDTDVPAAGTVLDVMPDGRLLISLDKSGKRIIRTPDEVAPSSADQQADPET
jgi:hypothetical protein